MKILCFNKKYVYFSKGPKLFRVGMIRKRDNLWVPEGKIEELEQGEVVVT